MKWTPEAEAALRDLKTYLSSAPTLVAPKPQEPLLLYLAATNQVVSAALVAQREVDEGEAAAIVLPLEKELNQSWQGWVQIRRKKSRIAKAIPRPRQRRRWRSDQFTLLAPYCRGLGQGTLGCRS